MIAIITPSNTLDITGKHPLKSISIVNLNIYNNSKTLRIRRVSGQWKILQSASTPEPPVNVLRDCHKSSDTLLILSSLKSVDNIYLSTEFDGVSTHRMIPCIRLIS